MRRRLEVLKLLTWYKSLREEQAKMEVANCRLNLEKLKQKKDSIISLRKNCYTLLEKERVLSGGDLKYVMSQIERASEFEKTIDNQIEMQKKELIKLLNALEKAYKERKLMERVRDKVQQLWNMEMVKKHYKEMDDLVILRREKQYE